MLFSRPWWPWAHGRQRRAPRRHRSYVWSHREILMQPFSICNKEAGLAPGQSCPQTGWTRGQLLCQWSQVKSQGP